MQAGYTRLHHFGTIIRSCTFLSMFREMNLLLLDIHV